MRFGLQHKQRGATFLGMVTIVAILGCGVYAGIRLVPLYIQHFAVVRAMNQTAETLKGGDVSPASIRNSLGRRWEVEDINQLDVKDIEINKVPNGVEMYAAYEARAPFIANVSLVVEFEKSVVIGSGGAAGL
jgi:hypothetical protein